MIDLDKAAVLLRTIDILSELDTTDETIETDVDFAEMMARSESWPIVSTT